MRSIYVRWSFVSSKFNQNKLRNSRSKKKNINVIYKIIKLNEGVFVKFLNIDLLKLKLFFSNFAFSENQLKNYFLKLEKVQESS
jgi:hypothetical protein